MGRRTYLVHIEGEEVVLVELVGVPGWDFEG
jgi:hypothetical protein